MNENGKTKKSKAISKHSLNTRLSDQAPKTKKSVTVISHNRRSADANFERNASIDQKLLQPKNSSEKYAKPELHSALILAKRLDALKTATHEKLTDLNQMTPRTKTIATEKALKKLNFRPDKSVYKHLVPVNVNDSVLDVKPSSTRRQSTSKSRVQTVKDPEPTLSHYLKPVPRLEHILTLDDVDDDSDYKKPSINQFANNQFKRMYEFYEQYLCPVSVHIHGQCDSENTDSP